MIDWLPSIIGKCLTRVYVNNNTKMLWECEHGHQFWMIFKDVSAGHWCAKCSGLLAKTREDYDSVANLHNGKFISKEMPKNIHDYGEWECELGHRFCALYNNVQQGHWCPKCAPTTRAKTMTELYGVAHALQCKEFSRKAILKAKNAYTVPCWLTGEERVATGSYERDFLLWVNDNHLVVEWQIPFKMPNGLLYFVDAYFPKINLYVEIKGSWRLTGLVKWAWFHRHHEDNSELWDKKVLKSKGISVK